MPQRNNTVSVRHSFTVQLHRFSFRREQGDDSVCLRSYLVLRVSESYAERLHGSDHGLHGCVDVLEDQFGVAPLVLVRVSSSVYYPHLLDEGALSTLPSA